MLYDLHRAGILDTARLTQASNLRTAEESDSGMRYDGVDWSEWQFADPVWNDLSSHQMLVARVCDGTHYDPYWEHNWQNIQGQAAPYKGFYVLPDPRLGWKAQAEYAKSYYDRAGVTFGQEGHFYSIDDEPTPYHGQMTGNEMRSFRHYLEDIFQKEELHYVGLYNGNYGFIQDEGWQLWGPWPIGNGALPSWTTNLVAWQWGVAGPGEVPGFPNVSVDVNMIMDTAVMDRLSGRQNITKPIVLAGDEEMARQALCNGTVWMVNPPFKQEMTDDGLRNDYIARGWITGPLEEAHPWTLDNLVDVSTTGFSTGISELSQQVAAIQAQLNSMGTTTAVPAINEQAIIQTIQKALDGLRITVK